MTGAGVQSGSLGRWFEELCRIRRRKLREGTVSTGTRLESGKLPSAGGVYAFWWTGPLEILRNQANRSIVLHGPGGRPVPLQFDDGWLGLSTGLPVPLYVGKTAGSIASRVEHGVVEHGVGSCNATYAQFSRPSLVPSQPATAGGIVHAKVFGDLAQGVFVVSAC